MFKAKVFFDNLQAKPVKNILAEFKQIIYKRVRHNAHFNKKYLAYPDPDWFGTTQELRLLLALIFYQTWFAPGLLGD